MKNIKSWNNFTIISEGLTYHIENNLSIAEPIYRIGSEKWHNLITECKSLYKQGKDFGDDNELLETDMGEIGMYITPGETDGIEVLLDIPFEDDDELNEAEYKGKKVSLSKPFRSSGPKKYAVYVKNPKTDKVIKVNFGDAKGGLRSKINDPDARRQFSQRHSCSTKKDKTTPGYWSCRLPRYSKLLGLAGNFKGYW